MARVANIPSPSAHLPVADPPSTTSLPPTRIEVKVKSEETSDDESRPLPDDQSFHPNGTRSLSFISIQAFALGNVLSFSFLLAIWYARHGDPIWRLPAFFTFLSLFHFLEFYLTARFNAPATRASSFLLFNNGRAYTAAHTLATLEIVASHLFSPAYRDFLFGPWNLLLGFGLIAVGQSVRSVAMAQAGTNFNHVIARERKDSHMLVTDGVYALVRHPSYFGFFWWAIGTQVLVGNKVCLLGYAVVLWRFFQTRIQAEERFLVRFFDDKYLDYRKRTSTGIPLIP